MGPVKLIGQMVQLLTGQRNETKDMTSVLQTESQHTEQMASGLQEVQETPTSMRMCSPVDAIRHIAQDACGDIWGLDQECFQVAAQMFQSQGIFTRGQLPVFADISRGKFFAAQEVLRRHQLLSENPEWQDGTVAFSLPSIQSKLIQASGNGQGALTGEHIDQVLGINQQIRGELNQAIAQARPAHHTGDQAPVLPQDPQYINQIYEMLPRHAVASMFQGRFQRP